MMFPQNMLPICQNVYWRKGIRMLEAGGLRLEAKKEKHKEKPSILFVLTISTAQRLYKIRTFQSTN